MAPSYWIRPADDDIESPPFFAREAGPMTIIVSGPLYLDPSEREGYLAGCRAVIEAARAAEGCLDFHLSADPIEADRINVYERWESVDAVEAFRGSGPSSEQAAAIRDARVVQYEIAHALPL
jgi:quinol monooxygenase YgiN